MLLSVFESVIYFSGFCVFHYKIDSLIAIYAVIEFPELHDFTGVLLSFIRYSDWAFQFFNLLTGFYVCHQKIVSLILVCLVLEFLELEF